MSDGRIAFGPFELDLQRRILWREGVLVPLAPKALDLLCALVAEAGEVVTKQDLLDRVWPDTFVEEANLSVNMSLVRKALGTDGGTFLQTVPRRGYRFVGARPQAPAADETLAVLPFRVLGGADEAFLGVGLADALITRLTAAGHVVRPTRAVLRYGEGTDPAVAARELQVARVLDGSVQRGAGRLRLSVQLVAGGSVAWAQQFETPAADLLAAQDELADRVASALAQRVAAAPRRPTADPAAWETYLRGRVFWMRLTADGLQRAFAAFTEAAERDPHFAAPRAALAEVHLVLGFTGAVSPREAWAEAESAARAALERDPDSAEAHVALAYVTLFDRWDWPAAEALLERAVALSPSAPSLHWYALFLDMEGRFVEAAAALERARALDPVSVLTLALDGLQRHLAGDAAGQEAAYRRAIEIDPGHFLGWWGLGLALQERGRAAEALEAHERALDLASGAPFLHPVLARSLAVAGRRKEATAALAAHADASPFQRATVQVALGDHAAAVAELERAAAERDPWLTWIAIDPMLAPLRGEAPYEKLLARVGPPRRRRA